MAAICLTLGPLAWAMASPHAPCPGLPPSLTPLAIPRTNTHTHTLCSSNSPFRFLSSAVLQHSSTAEKKKGKRNRVKGRIRVGVVVFDGGP